MKHPFALAAALLALTGMAHAGRPLATEDADVLDRSQCEAEGFYARLSASGTPDTRGWTLQGACGIGGNTQVALATAARAATASLARACCWAARPASSAGKATDSA